MKKKVFKRTAVSNRNSIINMLVHHITSPDRQEKQTGEQEKFTISELQYILIKSNSLIQIIY